MADQGTFDYWIGDRMTFSVMVPKSGSTGDFDQWLSDRMGFQDYAAAADDTALSVNISPSANYVQVTGP